MMGKKALDAAKILIEETGLQGHLTPEEFLKEREAKLDELFPQAELLPGKLPTLKLPSTVLARPCTHFPCAPFLALRSPKLFVWSKTRHFPKFLKSPLGSKGDVQLVFCSLPCCPVFPIRQNKRTRVQARSGCCGTCTRTACPSRWQPPRTSATLP